MASTKPTFVFVPGAWHSDLYFQPLITLLSSPPYSYPCTTVYLPTILTPLSPSTWSVPKENFEPDVDTIREKIESILDTGRNVVVVMHSWGGIPGSEAMKYFRDGGYADILGKEGKGRVERMVWVCAFALGVGGSLSIAVGEKDLDWWDVDREAKTMMPIDPQRVFYNDISPEIAAPMIADLRPFSYNPIFRKLTYSAFTTIPSTYVICDNDQAFPVAAQLKQVETIRASVGEREEGKVVPFDVVEMLPAGHTPFISHTGDLAEILDRAAGDGK